MSVHVLGVGMHPWGKWGRPFQQYGLHAALAALADAGMNWEDIDFVSGASTMRAGYPGYVSAATHVAALGRTGVPVTSSYAACASGAMAIDVARNRILAGRARVALVVGADTTPKGFLAPNRGERPDDPDWLRFRLLGATNPTFFGMYARRRMDRYGTTERDLALVKVKNSRHAQENRYARYRDLFTTEDVLRSPMVADPLRLLNICATSDGGAALVLASSDVVAKVLPRTAPELAAVALSTPRYPNPSLELPDIATDASTGDAEAAHDYRTTICSTAFEEAGAGPSDVEVAEVYDLSSAMELDWYEAMGLCRAGEAEELLRSDATSLGGPVPVNPSGGLGAFGEAVAAQAIAQVCELAWQLRGSADGRQITHGGRRPRVGMSANVGLFGHGSSVILRA